MTAIRPKEPRKRLPRLYYGGVEVARVFSVDRTRETADVHLMFDAVGTSRFVHTARLTGSRVGPKGGFAARLTDAEIREQLEYRAGICFGAWPEPEPAAEVAPKAA